MNSISELRFDLKYSFNYFFFILNVCFGKLIMPVIGFMIKVFELVKRLDLVPRGLVVFLIEKSSTVVCG